MLNLYYNGEILGEEYKNKVKIANIIGKIMKLIPYLHKQENFLYMEKLVNGKKYVEPLNPKNICDIFKISNDNIAREIKRLSSIVFPVSLPDGNENNPSGKNMYLFVQTENEYGKVFMINPAIVYCGDNERYKELIQKDCFYPSAE